MILAGAGKSDRLLAIESEVSCRVIRPAARWIIQPYEYKLLRAIQVFDRGQLDSSGNTPGKTTFFVFIHIFLICR